MKVVFLAHQFRDGEGISEYCKDLAGYLVQEGHEASIVAFEDGSDYSADDRVDVHRVPLNFSGDNMFNWAMMLNNEIKGQVSSLMEEEDIDLIHANEWTTVPGAITLSRHLERPLVVTLHSTENERGFDGEHSGMISELEWKAGRDADQLLTTKRDTRDSLIFDLDVPEDKIEVVDPYDEGWEERVLSRYQLILNKREEAVAR